jgi:uncharacterized protein (TIGR02391 family)
MSTEHHPPIEGAVLEGIAKVLGDTDRGLTGPEIGKYLVEVGIVDVDSQNSKWKRLFNAFVNFQNLQQRSNNILKFINKTMSPARFVGKQEQFEDLRFELNKRLGFIGLRLGESGKFQKSDSTQTISEAEKKASRLKNKLESRNCHPKIFEYCRAELVAENYFHTVFEAVKSVAEEIRRRTNLTEDGSELIERTFSLKNPLIKINDLASETQESEHKGFANLIKGVFGMFRNTTAHAPKIVWPIAEQDALDILSTISLIHRRLGTNTNPDTSI